MHFTEKLDENTHSSCIVTDFDDTITISFLMYSITQSEVNAILLIRSSPCKAREMLERDGRKKKSTAAGAFQSGFRKFESLKDAIIKSTGHDKKFFVKNRKHLWQDWDMALHLPEGHDMVCLDIASMSGKRSVCFDDVIRADC